MNLIDVVKEFPTDEECLKYIEQMRWPDGVVRCPLCGCDRISRITRHSKTKNVRKSLYQCLETTCKQQFSATSGTIFNDSHLPLHKWFMALAIVVDAKKSISANQLKEHLGIGSYRTAWYMAHRIRKAMEDENDPFNQLRGTVEIDETYIGVSVSPHIKTSGISRVPVRTRKSSNGNGGGKQAQDEEGDDTVPPPQPPTIAPPMATWQQMLLAKFPSFDPAWAPDVQAKWFESFDRLMKSGEAKGGGGQ